MRGEEQVHIEDFWIGGEQDGVADGPEAQRSEADVGDGADENAGGILRADHAGGIDSHAQAQEQCADPTEDDQERHSASFPAGSVTEEVRILQESGRLLR